MQKFFITSFVLWLFLQGSSSAHEISGGHSIHMQGKKYDQTSLTINVGETVYFENKDDIPYWPASNIHPTHGIYPEFDPKEPVSPGETWTFTFDKAGRWKFHDHLYPEIIGEIIVNDIQKPSTSKLPVDETDTVLQFVDSIRGFSRAIKIKSLKFYFKLFPDTLLEKTLGDDINETVRDEEALKFWLEVSGAKAIVEKIMIESENGNAFDCHQLIHEVGRVAYELYGTEAFKYSTYDCISGYPHGVMESFLRHNGTDNIADDIERLCSEFESSFGRFECLHGAGHGVMAYENYDLPSAIGTCRRLKDGFAQNSCFGGVFMENIVVGQNQSLDSLHSTKWVNADPHYPCNAIEQSFSLLQECYQMQTSRMLFLNGYNFFETVAECLKAKANMVSICFRSYGRDASGHTLRNQEKIYELCSLVPKEKDYYDQCVIGALHTIVDFWGDKLENQADTFCDRASETTREHCFSVLSGRKKGLEKSL